MKRCIWGAAVLIALLAGCILCDRAASRGPEELADTMALAAATAMTGDREKTAALTQMAGAAWKKTRPLQTWVRHEDQVQQVDLLFGDLAALRGREAGRIYGAICLRLSLRARALARQDLLLCLPRGR